MRIAHTHLLLTILQYKILARVTLSNGFGK